jgi:hypothetical protein
MTASHVTCLLGVALAATLGACSSAGPSASAGIPTPGLPASTAPSLPAAASTKPAAGATSGASGAVVGAVEVAGTHVTIVPPDGFVPAASFPGFEHEGSGSSVVVTEIPGSYSQIAGAMTDERVGGEGITITSRTDVMIDGRPSLLLEGTQQAYGMTFGKVMLVTGTEALTATVTGNYPADEASLESIVRAAVLTTSFDPDRQVDPAAALRFTISPAPPLRFAGVIMNGALYNTSGAVPSADPGEPYLIVAPSLGDAGTSDLAALAREQLRQAEVTDVVAQDPADVTIGGLSGIELTATAKGPTGGAEVFVYEVLLFDRAGVVTMIGVCPIERRAECLGAFEETTRTYRPKG